MNRKLSSTNVENPSTRTLIMEAGGPLRAGENRTAWLARIAQEAGVSDRTLRAAWYGERNAEQTIAKLKRAVSLNEYRKYLETAVGLENLAFSLEEKNKNRFSLHIDVFRSCAGQIRALVRSASKKNNGG